MAQYRSIKMEFFTSEDVMSCTPLARLFFIGLWIVADREGRLKWSPVSLKTRILPTDTCDVEDLGKELSARGMLEFYKAGGTRYAAVVNFKDHQYLNNRERESVLPPPHPPNVREGKSKSNVKRVIDASPHAADASFDVFWKAYQNKVGKGHAEKWWKKHKPDEFLQAQILAAIAEQERVRAEFIAAGKWYKLRQDPLTWLNAKGWLNQPEEKTSSLKPTGKAQATRGFLSGRGTTDE